MENLDLGDQSEDFMICCDNFSEKSTDMWKTRLELHEDNKTTFSSCSNKFDNQYQVLAIIGDNSEEFDDNNNSEENSAKPEAKKLQVQSSDVKEDTTQESGTPPT
jgi:predicted secreted acid phosphatase